MISILNVLFPIFLALAGSAPQPSPTNTSAAAAAAKQCNYCCPCPIGNKDWGK